MSISETDFYSIYTHGFVRVAAAVPTVEVADPVSNIKQILELARRADENGAALTLFPELGVSAYTNDDLFQQDALLEAVLAALQRIIEESRELNGVLLVGAPLRFEHQLFNCALAVHRGRLLGVVPKTYLPDSGASYEKRQFSSAREAVMCKVDLFGQKVPFGNDLVFTAHGFEGFTFAVELGEDLHSPVPPSCFQALAGARILCNLSADNALVGRTAERRELCAAHSKRTVSGYLYSSAGAGESTTDLAWDGHGLVYENGEKLAESNRFSWQEELVFADIDLERIAQERTRQTSFSDGAHEHKEAVSAIRKIGFDFTVPGGQSTHGLQRRIERFPYISSDTLQRDEHCFEAFRIQVQGLVKRLKSSGIEKIVIGVSGGLDSTHALLVAVQAMDEMGLPRENILGFTMPGFATSDITHENAHALMSALRISAKEIDIRPSCLQMLRDLEHPFAEGEPVYDITFENVQAGERTSHLFRLANFHGALVLGTGDASELALGWCTYGVGDHMSHYNPNSGVPKTLIQYLIRWVIADGRLGAEAARILDSILSTEISPELVPYDENEDLPESERRKPAQSTQAQIGPYELQDFHLYHIVRYGFRPSKIAFLAHQAWGDKTRGSFPEYLSKENRNEYSLAEIKHWLEVFLWRFFQTSQFKRSCVPNGPAVIRGAGLSPRSNWRAPSDSQSRVWLDELKKSVP